MARIRSILLITIILSALATGTVALTAWTRSADMFDLESIEFGGASRLSDQSARALISVEKGVNIFTLDLDAIEDDMERDPRIRKVNICRRLPSTLAVAIEEREPVMLIGGERLLALDEEGVVMPIEGAGLLDIPVLTGVHPPVEPGSGAHHLGIQKGLEIRKAVAQEAPVLWDAISEINLRQLESPRLYLTAGGAEVRLGGVDLGTQIQRLWIVLRDLAAKEAVIYMLDLRFKDQLICRSTGKSRD
jgi:cell division septal protein FtsQ